MASRYEKELHDREVDAWKKVAELALEQVEYLRLQLAAQPASTHPAAMMPRFSPTPVPMESGAEGDEVMSDVERDLRQMYADGHMDEDELGAALQALREADLLEP